MRESGIYQMYLKNLLDRLLALVGTAALSWLLILLGIAIHLDSPGPIFFRQKRAGKNGTYFYIYKFRTMRIDTPHDMPTHMLNNPDLFITRVGRFLRKTSLDELPQLFNILKGDMALVGPRPALWNQYDLLTEREQYGANSVRPGLTGWAQIHGRDELPIRQKAELDGYYVHHIQLKMDLECLWRTARRKTGKTADEGCKRGCEGWKIEEDKKDRKRQRKIEKQQKIEKVVKDSKR